MREFLLQLWPGKYRRKFSAWNNHACATKTGAHATPGACVKEEDHTATLNPSGKVIEVTVGLFQRIHGHGVNGCALAVRLIWLTSFDPALGIIIQAKFIFIFQFFFVPWLTKVRVTFNPHSTSTSAAICATRNGLGGLGSLTPASLIRGRPM